MTTGSVSTRTGSSMSLSCGAAFVGSTFQRTWNGADTPPGQPRVVNNPYTTTVVSTEEPIILWSTPKGAPSKFNGTVSSCFGSSTGSVGSLTNWGPNDDLKVFNKLANRVRQNSFNASNFLAEGHQALALISDSATRLAMFLESIRHGKIQSAVHHLMNSKLTHNVRKRNSKGDLAQQYKLFNALNPLKRTNGQDLDAMANAILEVQYGWRPILKDAADAGTALASIVNREDRESYSARRKLIEVEIQVQPNLTFAVRETCTVNLKTTAVASQSISNILRLNDPLGALYEITPWSFIGDWFIPLGDWLSAVNAIKTLNFGEVVVSKKIIRTVLCRGASTSADLFLSGHEGYSHKNVMFTRSIVQPTTYNLPLPHLKDMSKALSPEHALNAIALLRNTSSSFSKSLKF